MNRFNVSQYEDFYKNLLRINVRRIFTTNIDNLISKIYEGSNRKYINNILKNGACFGDESCVDYIPLHGSIEEPEDKFIFNIQDVSSSFNLRNKLWVSLGNAAEQIPTLFLGYSLSDSAAIEALFSDSSVSVQKNKWILLKDNDNGLSAYFKALGFKIIVGELKDFFEYVERCLKDSAKDKDGEKDSIFEIFPNAKVPKESSNLIVRPIEDFFLGDAPIWSDILSKRIHTTAHLDQLVNLAEQNKSIVITGIPASGKSTILLQLARILNQSKRVLIFNNISVNKSNIIKNEIKSPTVILIDDFTSDIEAFVNLEDNYNIKLIGFDRYYYYDISSHRLSKSKYNFYDVSDLTREDIQGIYEKIPLGLKKSPMTSKIATDEVPSVFEIVNYNINKTNIKERYNTALEDLEENNPDLLDLLVVTCYLHSCRVPVSYEVINAYFDYEYSYNEIADLMGALQGMIKEVAWGMIDEYHEQDYFQPRSQILAETIIEQTKTFVFKSVFEKFHNNVSRHLIPKFYIFKRFAYDAYYASKAFNSWNDGLSFYEKIFTQDGTPFVLQQCALYLLKKKEYSEAAIKIDKAIQISNKRFFSIENTHAIILFKSNVVTPTLARQSRSVLDRSMQILQDCYNTDQRKTYHAVTFAEQALEYFSVFDDFAAKKYLELAKKWLQEIEVEKKYDYRAKILLKQLNRIR